VLSLRVAVGSQKIVYLNREFVKKTINYNECIDLLREMFIKAAKEIDEQPPRTIISVGTEGVILTMPSYSKSIGKFAVKIVTEFKRNPERFGIPVQGGSIILTDSENGMTLALIDSPSVTEVRTASLCALATDILARKEAENVSVIGSGKEARAILEAICNVRKIRSVKVKSRKFENAIRFANDMSGKIGIEISACEETGEATKDADIVIAATNSETPVLDYGDVGEGVHVVSIGTLPTRRELGDELISHSSVFVDTRRGVLREAGDIMHAIEVGKFSPEKIKAEMWELVQRMHNGRESSKEITLFKSVGFGLMDVYVASMLYEKMLKTDSQE
jgi:ornithine cyclodeaminase/alanine dehydrogenase-like protein (mu-crystallin family)